MNIQKSSVKEQKKHTKIIKILKESKKLKKVLEINQRIWYKNIESQKRN